MSFLYPRVISVSRPKSTTSGQLGDVGYNAIRGSKDEDPVVSDLPASIQLDRQGQRNPAGLAADAKYEPIWKVFIPKSAAPLGTIQSSDVITDDLGVRYQVVAPYWNSLGYALTTIVLEV